VGQQHAAARDDRLGLLIAHDPIRGIVEAVERGVVVNVHVQPRAGATRVLGRHGDALKIRVTAAPVAGEATHAAQRALADALAVPRATVRLVSGARSRTKRFLVSDLEIAAARARVRALVDATQA
jgi:uncharacterized protein